MLVPVHADDGSFAETVSDVTWIVKLLGFVMVSTSCLLTPGARSASEPAMVKSFLLSFAAGLGVGLGLGDGLTLGAGLLVLARFVVDCPGACCVPLDPPPVLVPLDPPPVKCSPSTSVCLFFASPDVAVSMAAAEVPLTTSTAISAMCALREAPCNIYVTCDRERSQLEGVCCVGGGRR